MTWHTRDCEVLLTDLTGRIVGRVHWPSGLYKPIEYAAEVNGLLIGHYLNLDDAKRAVNLAAQVTEK